jgi:hypothetical protein
MAVNAKTAKDKGKQKTTIRKAPKSAPVKKAKSTPVKRARRTPVDGLELLRQAVDRKLQQIAEDLATRLGQCALEGKLDNTRMMVSLAEKKAQPVPVKDTRLNDLIAQWETGPQWKDAEEAKNGELGRENTEAVNE